MSLTEKAFLEIEGSAETLPCMFNPAELSVARSNSWSGVSLAGQGVPQVKYLGANSGTMSLQLMFDTTDSGEAVTKYTGKVLKLMDVDASLPGTDPLTNNARPPYVVFHWGNLHSFKAVVSSMNLQFTYFSSTGVPLRAKVDLSLTQFAQSAAFGPQNPTSGTPEPHRVHRVQPGETLDRISARYYGDSTRWRAIATANGVVDPLALRPGSLLHPAGRTMTSALSLIAPEIKVNGALVGDLELDQLDGVRISRSLGLPGRAVLRFSDIGYSVAAGQSFGIGAEVEISTVSGTSLFLGEVTGVDLNLDRGQPEFTVIADDLAYKMTLGTKVRTFTMLTYSEVISKIAQEYGLQAQVSATSESQEYLMQSDSDFGFVTEIADRTGSDWWLDGRTLHFQPATTASTAVRLTVGEQLESFSVRASALHPGTPTICGWWPKTKQSVMATGTASTSGSTANLVGPYLAASKLTQTNATVSTADMPGDQTEAESLADRLVERWTAGAVTAKGSCPADSRITPGGSVEIADAGPASGTYHVTEVEHSYSARGFETRFTAGDRRPSSLVDVLSGGRPSSFRRDGLVIGIVTMVGNQQGSAGDVKVKYVSIGDQVESNWARVVTLGAGSGRGMTFIPEINDEVIVGFEGGDARRPVVLGGVYNGKDIPVEFGVQNNTVSRRRITSRLGHFVEFGDGTDPANQHIDLNLAGGAHQVRLGKDALTAKVPSGVPVTIGAGDASIEITQDGSIILSGTKITLKSKTDVEISGVNITAKASVKAAISGTMTEVKGSATGEFSAGGAVTIKGAMVAVN